MSSNIVVYGATGLVGGRVCTALDAAEVPFIAAGRRRMALDKLARLVEPAGVRVAEIEHAALVKAFEGASVVINCAGPLAEMGEAVLVAALEAGAHYVDIGGDQAFLHDIYERYESSARKAGKVVVPGCGLNCAIGDWAAAWASAHVCGVADEGDVVRAAQAPRLGEDQPLDEVAVSYLFDDLVLSPASQKAVFGNLHTRGLAWRRDRWETVTPGIEKKRVNAGPEMGGERDAVSFPGGDVVTVPRHIAANRVQTYLSMTRSQVATTALRFLARAMPFVPKRATDLLAAYQPAEDEYARTHFAVVAQARRRFDAAQIV
ncbi:MAG TPA: saccharopine dehydrogenase NADP-binding domain-containing protein, partial [Kofleriaceae bacterium]|nr:saccharopine dehydrogenase NADP-binding domain-containing protein [Kofleriaceae bacterium]